jgi:hypothetical protein
LNSIASSLHFDLACHPFYRLAFAALAAGLAGCSAPLAPPDNESVGEVRSAIEAHVSGIASAKNEASASTLVVEAENNETESEDSHDPIGNIGKNSCDVCVTTKDETLFVRLPQSFTTSSPDGTLAIRVFAGNARDFYIARPPGAQRFTIKGIDVAEGATITVYAPGVAPPPRSQNE